MTGPLKTLHSRLLAALVARAGGTLEVGFAELQERLGVEVHSDVDTKTVKVSLRRPDPGTDDFDAGHEEES